MIGQIIFAILSILTFGYAAFQFNKIRQNILLGQEEKIEGDTSLRLKNMFLVAFGQQKMFKRFVPAIFHLFIYVAFLMTQIELIEILIDGFTGSHRFFASMLGGLYNFIINFIEVLSALAFVATFVFLARRNLLKLPRFHKAEMNGWPKLDGNLILYGEFLLLIGIFSMNGADMALQAKGETSYSLNLIISSNLGPAIFGGLDIHTLHIIEKFGWWLHILVVFGFINYLPKSKHLHIFFAFPNTYYSKLDSRGKMENMDSIMNEVKSMMDPEAAFDDSAEMEELPVFGSNDVTTLSWRNLLESYTCTECGRCTSVCPANMTGKKLSPRKVMMDIRDRAEEVGDKIRSGNPEYIRDDAKSENAVLSAENFDDGKSLFDYISKEEIHACTTCNACVEACPILINPMESILKLRRYELLTESAGPTEWLPMFNSIENNGAVWSMSESRDQWVNELNKEND
ncbi:MAG: (Fe-S)-binding protein [Saprospiraceae bacterium]|nr:(Fe-S)-binding protein [Saprospiraceae bacterium]